MTKISPMLNRHSSIIIWLVGVSFVLFQFFLQLSSGIVIGSIMGDMNFSALTAGLLGASLYVIYTTLQIPVGILFDHKNTRVLISINAFICSLGCLLFSNSHGLVGLFIGRILIGSGSAFAFIGLSHLLRQHFPLKQFSFMIGVSETLGFLITVIGMICMGQLLAMWGWRSFIQGAGIIGLLIAWLSWKIIPNTTSSRITPHYSQQLLQIVCNSQAWINGIYVGLCFSIITVFGSLWAIPFLQIKLGCNMSQASIIGAMFFLGAALSCPLFGYLSTRCNRRRPLILSSCLSTTLLLLLLLYLPNKNSLFTAGLMFTIGICCGAYMLAYTIANEISPPNSFSTCTGFTNTLALMTAPILQPFTGYLLDIFSKNGEHSLMSYQCALITIPLSLSIALVLIFFLPEKNHR
ncbi:MAG: MFS transporter [Legionella sp.]